MVVETELGSKEVVRIGLVAALVVYYKNFVVKYWD